MDDEQETLWHQITTINEGVYKMWALYVHWYTWFFGANLLVLSWIFVNRDSAIFAENKAIVCGIWVIMNLLGTTTSVMLSLHSRRINQRIQELLDAATIRFAVNADDILARSMTMWGGLANALALAINAGLWLFLYQS